MQTTRLTRRRVLLGIAGVGSAGAVGGIGTTVLTGSRQTADGPARDGRAGDGATASGPTADGTTADGYGRDGGGAVDRVTLAVAVLGRSIEATPPLLAMSVAPGGSERGTVRLRVREPGGSPTLRFGRVPQPAAGDSGPEMGFVGDLRVRVELDGEPVRTGPFEGVFDGGGEPVDDRLCPREASRLGVAVDGPARPPPALTDAALAGTVLVSLDGSGCDDR